jgi:arylsulfatase A-like enzyme
MMGQKSTLFEGGIRTFLAVRGPGVPAGATDSSLRSVTDILPTLSDLAGITSGSIAHMPWDGISFVNLLKSKVTVRKLPDGDVNGLSSDTSRRVASQQQQQQQQQEQQKQQERMVFVVGPYC